MADAIEVRFGADIAGLVAGVTTVKGEIKSLLAPIEEVKKALGGITEAIGAAFLVHEVKEFITGLAELGEKALNTAFILGTTVKESDQVVTAMRILGVNADAASKTLQFLGHSVQQALVDPSGRAAVGFRNIGISMDEVRTHAHNLTGLLELVIEHVNNLAASGLVGAGALRDTLGRGLQTLAPLLRATKEEFEEARAAAEAHATAMAENAGGMDKTAQSMHKLGVDVETFGIKLFRLFKDAIDGVVKALDYLVNAGTWAIGWLERIADAFGKVRVDATNAGLAVHNFIASLTGLGTAVPYLEYAKKPDYSGTVPHGTQEIGTDKAGKGKGKGKGTDDRMSVWRDELREKLESEQNFFKDSKAEELAFWQQKLATISSGSQQDLKLRREVNAQIFSLEKALARQTEQQAIEEITFKARYADVVYAGKKEHLDAEIALGKITATQGIAEEKRLLDAKWALDNEYFDDKQAAAKNDVNTLNKLIEEQGIAWQQYQNKLQALDDKLAEDQKKTADKIAQPFTQAFDQIGSTFESMITGMITHSSTIQSSLKKLWDGILGDFTKMIGDMLSQWAASGLANLLGVSGGGAGGIGSVLGSALGGLFGKGAGAAGGGGIGGFLSGLPIIGGLFGGGGGGASYGAAVDLGLFSRGGIVSAAGGWSVPSTGVGGTLAQLHPNEMVLPAEISKGLQGMIAGGGGGGGDMHMHFHGPADAPSMQRFFKDMLKSNGSTLRQMAFSSAFTGRNLSTNTG